jgi:hypothetical protein
VTMFSFIEQCRCGLYLPPCGICGLTRRSELEESADEVDVNPDELRVYLRGEVNRRQAG